jgi:putative MATE family efflux protein
MEKRDLKNGSIRKNLLYMSVPTMMGFVFQMLYDIIDMIWIGRISKEAVAAVTIFMTIFWLVDILNSIIGASSVSLISQAYGKEDANLTSKTIEQTLVFKALVAVIAAALVFMVLKPITNLFTTDEIVKGHLYDYGYLRLLFLPVMFSTFTVNTALRGIGDSISPMKIMIAAAIINAVLDPILMFDVVPLLGVKGFGLGVKGAAVATVISITFSLIAGMRVLLVGRSRVKIHLKGLMRLDKEIDYKLMTIGLPTGAEMFFRNVSWALVLLMISTYGTTAIAVAGVGSRLMGLAIMPLVGLSMGGSTIVGQCLGAKNIERAEKTAVEAAKLGIFVMVIMTILAMVFSKEVMMIFLKDADAINMGVLMIRIIQPGIMTLGILFGLSSVFQGSGYNIPMLISSIISRWCIQIPMTALVVYVFKLSIVYVWIIFAVSETVETVVGTIYYFKGKWKTHRVV